MSQPVDALGFLNFIDGQNTKINAAFREIEELQKLFQGSYTRFRAEHDKTLAALGAQIESARDGSGDALKAPIDARVPAERKTIDARVATLEQKLIPGFQTEADKVLARAQSRTQELRTKNPQLNDREEKLKAEIAAQTKTLADLNTQVQKLSSGLGFIFNIGKIHALDAQRQQTVGRLQTLNQQLTQIRQEWKKLHDDVSQEEHNLQVEWQTASVTLGKLRQEHDYLAQNAAAEARHRAITFVIDNLKTMPPGANNSAAFKPMIDLNIQTDDFQAALGAVAGILGVLKGIEDGLTRIFESVKALKAEQAKNSAYLPSLQFELPDAALAFAKTWDDLIAKSKDDKYLGAHPAEYIAAIQPFLDERLTKEHITDFFNGLGDAIQRATAGWKSK